MGLNKSLIGLVGLSVACCFATGCGDSDGNNDNNVDPGSGNKPQVCKDDAYKCDGNKLLICKSNKWETKLTCNSTTETCNSEQHKCDAKTSDHHEEEGCENDAIKCEGKKSYKCEAKEWHLVRTCDMSETCDKETGACQAPQCQVGHVRCDGNTLVACMSSGKEKSIPCENNSVCDAKAGKCVENAEAETIRCTLPDGTTKLNNGDSICYNSNLVTCEAGDIDEEECQENYTCYEGEAKCSQLKICHVAGKILKTGEYACDDKKDVVRCMDGDLSLISDCQGNEVCMVADETYGCGSPAGGSCSVGNTTVESGKRICEGNVLKLCYNGTLSGGSDCKDNSDGKTLCLDGRCIEAVCENGKKEGEKSCNEAHTQIQICTGGKLVDATGTEACTAEQVCQSGDTVKCIEKSEVKSYTTIPSIHEDYNALTKADTNPNECKGSSSSHVVFLKDAEVKITNAVVTATKTNGFFIQDPTVPKGVHAGILVNCTKSNCVKEGFTDDKIEVGNNVNVTAKYVGHQDCQLWISTQNEDKIQVTKTNGNAKVDSQSVAVSEMNTGKHNDYTGTLVKLENVKVASCEDKYCVLKDAGAKEASATNYIKALTVSTLKKNLNKSGDITGIVYYNPDLDASNIAPTLIEIAEEGSAQE